MPGFDHGGPEIDAARRARGDRAAVAILLARAACDLAAADQFIALAYVYQHAAAGPLEAREGYHQVIGMFQRAFPDPRFAIEDQWEE